MASFSHLCVMFLISCVTVNSGVLTGKAFFCRDPDTGKLHSVNSSWQSTTFCGNYTCKLKQKNNHKTNQELIKSVDIKSIVSDENKTIESSKAVDIEKTTLRLPDVLEKVRNNNDSAENNNNNKTSNDRYLTESEIKTISDILHTVKKSDLDAIVDVYNLAQDIYKEMDGVKTEVNSHETESRRDENRSNSDLDHKHVSYWYEPLHANNNKGKPVDMESAGTNTVKVIEDKNDNPNSYFRGTIAGTDFRKVPYYYPISAFQRVASYAHNKAQNEKASCKSHNTEVNQLHNRRPGYYPTSKTPNTGYYQRMIQPSILLPYPFSYIHHYNISSYPYNLNFNNYPWIQTGYHKKNSPRANMQKPTAYIAGLTQPNAEVEEIDRPLLEDNDLEALVKRKIDKMPEWQTEQLAAEVLDEVKANIQAKSMLKAFPFRKKVKLEKVGKVIKLDEIRRSKRNAEAASNESQESNDGELFEVFLERTTCHSDTQPGFFRVGNLSQPFPECCPQRIKNDSKANTGSDK